MVDTAERRFSMIGVNFTPILHVIPQGAIGKPGRATLMDLYSGIALDDPTASTASLLLMNRAIKYGS